MSALVAIIVTCWVCVCIATPRRPLLGNEVEELVYTRLHGRQQLLMLFAVAVTATGLFALALTLSGRAAAPPAMTSAEQTLSASPPVSRPIQQENSDLARIRGDHCIQPPNRPLTCFELQAGGIWTKRELRDGLWIEVGTAVAPPTGRDP